MKRFLLSVCMLMIPFWAMAQVTVTNDITTNTTWSAANEYLLDGLIFVDPGAMLTIEPGTVIKAKQQSSITTGDGASALIVRRGAKINAQGTPDSPIIFTSELDQLNGNLSAIDRGLWGGVIILGAATTNQPTTENQIEGIPPSLDAKYGGTNDADDSGIFTFVSIRHGGFSISGVPGDEINGLTMGAVGSQTVIHHIEVFANLDDGYEWFGGTVNTKYLISAFCADDAFDYDQGFRGKHQFWFAVQAPDEAGRGGEHDGGDDDETGTPLAIPMISNVTYLGAGKNATPAGDGNDRAIYFRDNAGGKYYNSIFYDFTGNGITVEDLASGDDSRIRMENGELVLANNYWFEFGAGNDLNGMSTQDFVRDHLAANQNVVADPMLRGTDRNGGSNGLDPRPMLNSPVVGAAKLLDDGFFTETGFVGAFDPNQPLWSNNWTALDAYGHTGDISGGSRTVVDVSADITTNTTWTANNEYLMDGLIFVDPGAELIIQPGTIIKAKQQSSITTGDGASALIVRRGAKINARGTATSPIIFTSELDNLNGNLSAIDRGLWGGVIILGAATTNQPTTENQIEGIPPALDAKYGGTNDADNSGVFVYASIRHGGFSISGVPGDEINGLTMGAVGSETEIHHIEVFSNLDDGYEWFGGAVNTKYLVAAFCADDAFDYDQGFRGKHQFWFSIQAPDEAGRAGEHDGGDDDETGTPLAIPVISNATYIGSGSAATPAGDGNDRTIYFRDNAGGKYYSSIFYDFTGYGITVEDLASGDDSRVRLENGELVLSNNIWFGYGAGNTLTAIAPQDFVQTHLTANNNQVADPQFASISREATSSLNPRPAAAGPAGSGAVVPSDAFFTQVSYKGAFNPDPNVTLWIKGWTALDQDGVLGIEAWETKLPEVPNNFNLSQNYPNPFNPSTNIRFDLVKSTNVKLSVYNIRGQLVATLAEGFKPAGSYVITWNAVDLSSGVYFYRLEADGLVESRKMMLLK